MTVQRGSFDCANSTSSQTGSKPHTSHRSALRHLAKSPELFFFSLIQRKKKRPKIKNPKKSPINCSPARARANESDSALPKRRAASTKSAGIPSSACPESSPVQPPSCPPHRLLAPCSARRSCASLRSAAARALPPTRPPTPPRTLPPRQRSTRQRLRRAFRASRELLDLPLPAPLVASPARSARSVDEPAS